MNSMYYLDANNAVQGPLTFEQLKLLYASGKITASTQVGEEGKDSWRPYYEVIGDETSHGPQSKSDSPNSTKKNKNSLKPDAHNPSTSRNFKGINQYQGWVLIMLLLVGIGAPFWIFLKPMPKWEYKTIEILADTSSSAVGDNAENLSYKTIKDYKLSSELRSLGSDGWELVSTFLEVETTHPNFGKEDYVTGLQPNVRPQKLVCILKRQVKK